LTEPVCPDRETDEYLVFPAPATIEKMISNGELHHLSGFENNFDDGQGIHFNFIMSNGQRSCQRDEWLTYTDHYMPEGAHKIIRSVVARWDELCEAIFEFKFFDKDKNLVYQIGDP